MQYLLANQEQLLSVARNDLAALQTWRTLVHEGQVEFDNRYRREYLTTERFHRFDEALVRLLELLELPGIGKALSTALYVVRIAWCGGCSSTPWAAARRRPRPSESSWNRP
jgi:hypothetical protein